MRVLIVGDRPEPNTNPKDPLYIHTDTGCGARLRDLFGISTEEYLWLRRMNSYHDGARTLDLPDAQERLRNTLDELKGRWLIVLLGNDAAKSFNGRVMMGHAIDVRGHRVLFMPHPGRSNQFWKIKPNRLLYEKILRAELAAILSD